MAALLGAECVLGPGHEKYGRGRYHGSRIPLFEFYTSSGRSDRLSARRVLDADISRHCRTGKHSGEQALMVVMLSKDILAYEKRRSGRWWRCLLNRRGMLATRMHAVLPSEPNLDINPVLFSKLLKKACGRHLNQLFHRRVLARITVAICGTTPLKWVTLCLSD